MKVRRALSFWPLVAAAAAVVVAYLALAGSSSSPAARREQSLRQALVLAVDPRPKRRQVAEAALTRLSRTGPATLRAQAANVLAALLAGHGGGKQLAEATKLFASAVRLDQNDDDSKFDLELLLTLRGPQHGSARSRRASHDRRRTMPANAGHRNPGGGY